MGSSVLNCKQFLWHTFGSEQLSFHSTIKKLALFWGCSQQIAGHSQPGLGIILPAWVQTVTFTGPKYDHLAVPDADVPNQSVLEKYLLLGHQFLD